MASGFSGGGPDFYGAIAGRSMANSGTIQSNNQTAAPFRAQIPGIYMDSTGQIGNQTAPGFIGKRTLADFQAQQYQNHNHLGVNNFLLRSVKPRMEQYQSPISPLSGMDLRNFYSPASSRYGMPLLQQLRPQQISLGGSMNGTHAGITNNPTQIRVGPQESENKMMNQLQELEKQLLDDNEEENDAVSVVTNTNSEWSETIQNLISTSPKPISPSPTSSSTSTSSSSSSVASPATTCSKQTLIDAASAISEGKLDVFSEISARLAQSANLKGSSEQRLMEYMALALKSKANSGENPPPIAELFTKEHDSATRCLYDLSMCFKLGLMAANHAILEAALNSNSNSIKFHVIDFDIGEGAQYNNLIYALSKRQNGKPAMVKITAVADNGSDERIKSVGEELSQLGGRGVTLKFNVVVCPKLSDLSQGRRRCW